LPEEGHKPEVARLLPEKGPARVEELVVAVVLLADKAESRCLHFRAPSPFQVPSHYHYRFQDPFHSRCRCRCRSQLEGILLGQWPPGSGTQGQRLFQRMGLASEPEMGMERHHCPYFPCFPCQNPYPQQDLHSRCHCHLDFRFHFQDLLHCCRSYPYHHRCHLGFRIPRCRWVVGRQVLAVWVDFHTEVLPEEEVVVVVVVAAAAAAEEEEGVGEEGGEGEEGPEDHKQLDHRCPFLHSEDHQSPHHKEQEQPEHRCPSHSLHSQDQSPSHKLQHRCCHQTGSQLASLNRIPSLNLLP